ncbi:hypothetical protein [Paenibacillus nasutitermitis]|uniref:Uncharacterized protein n=1 Tax=Paenibacillus nasutitermitis TaxID=1652958 RepID=A0A917DQF6_9BACL|nr:hypothetical protein [Paenibacillus nasutitermitis]GGD56907.1 hypothetical protein GCM10010911_13320 [Paenibacillus nasutitermitis]
MIKRILSILSLALFILASFAILYSIVFPFKAGDPLQGIGYILVIVTSPVGLLAAASALSRRNKIALMAFIGHSTLLLLLFLYMTVGYLIFGV